MKGAFCVEALFFPPYGKLEFTANSYVKIFLNL